MISEIKGPHRAGPRRWALTRLYGSVPHQGGAYGVLKWEISLAICWEPRDLWIGLFWEHNEWERWVFYLCLLPMLPLRLKFRRHWG